MTKKDEDDPAVAAFNRNCDNLRAAIRGNTGWDACLPLIMTLAETIVFYFPEDEPDAGLRLAQSVQALRGIVGDMIDNLPGDRDPRPSPPSPDLLRKLLEQRRAAKKGP